MFYHEDEEMDAYLDKHDVEKNQPRSYSLSIQRNLFKERAGYSYAHYAVKRHRHWGE